MPRMGDSPTERATDHNIDRYEPYTVLEIAYSTNYEVDGLSQELSKARFILLNIITLI